MDGRFRVWVGKFRVSVGLEILFLTSCSAAQGKLYVMEGNFFHSRGRYPQAVAAYLKAQAYNEARGYAEFGLGSVYFALDEGALALERFQAAEKALNETLQPPNPELAYRIQYTTGVVRFKEGDYAGAAHSFRAALALDGGRVEAKRNLELSLLSLAQKKTPQQTAPETAEPEDPRDQTALFEYLRHKEQDLWKKWKKWKSGEWIEDAAGSGPDY